MLTALSSVIEIIERLLEPVGVRPFSLGQSFKPVCDLVKTFLSCGFRHPWIHIGVFMGFARDGRLQVLAGRTNRQPRGGITTLLQILQMTVGVTSFPFRG